MTGRVDTASAEDLERAESGRSLSLGFLAMLPLFLAYEWAVDATGGGRRNAAELFLGLGLSPLGAHADLARFGMLTAGAGLALYRVKGLGVGVRSGVARVALEGGIFAVALGPALIVLFSLLGLLFPELDMHFESPQGSPSLARAGLSFGGGAYEEILFRVGLYSLLFFASLRLFPRARRAEAAPRWVAEAVGLGLSSLAFSAFHLHAVTGHFWAGGEPFEPALFTWRLLAGLLLGGLFRWRGPGVAAWSHGLFNVTLLLGVGPEILL